MGVPSASLKALDSDSSVRLCLCQFVKRGCYCTATIHNTFQNRKREGSVLPGIYPEIQGVLNSIPIERRELEPYLISAQIFLIPAAIQSCDSAVSHCTKKDVLSENK